MRWVRPWTLAAVTSGLTVLTLALGMVSRWTHAAIPGAIVVLLPNLLLVLLIASAIVWIVMSARQRPTQ